MSAPTPLRRTIALSVIFALIVVFGLVGATSIDQGRPVVSNLADTAGQQIKVRGAALAVETARRLALEGHQAEAGKKLGEAVEAFKSAEAGEPSVPRKTKIHALLPLADNFGSHFESEAGAGLAAALAELDALQATDTLEAEVQGAASILNAAALYVVLLIIVVGAAAGAALMGLRGVR